MRITQRDAPFRRMASLTKPFVGGLLSRALPTFSLKRVIIAFRSSKGSMALSMVHE
jgi:hypothetical protein